MADALTLDITVDSIDAEAALIRLYDGFRKAGDSAVEAADKVTKFEKSYKDGSARQQAKRELDALSTSTGKASTATDMLTSAAMRYAAPAAVGAVIAKTLQWADSLSDLATKHRMTTDVVQKLGVIAERNGSSFDKYASLMEGASNRIAKGSKNTVEALDQLGLNIDELRAMDPYAATNEIARGLESIVDPAQKATLRMKLFGEASGDTVQMLQALGDEMDDVTNIVDKDMIAAGDKAISMWERFKGTVMAVTHEAILQSINPFVMLISYVDDLTTSLDDAATSADRLGKLLPGRPGAFGGAGGLPVPGDPMNGVGGQSWNFLNKSVTPKGGKAGTSSAPPVTPYTANQWAVISQILGPTNPLGNGGLGSFPGWAMPGVLASSMSLSSLGLGFDRNSSMVPFAGTVPMNAPGGGGGIGGMFKGRGLQLGMLAGGLAAQFLPGRAGQVAQGAMGMAGQGAGLGAMFGPHGAAIGAGIGALVGGVSSLFGGGKAKKNAASAETMEVFGQFTSKEFLELQKQAEKFGISMDKALTAKTMKDFGAAVDEVNTKLQEMNDIQSQIDYLTEQTTVTFDKMKSVVNEFGLDISKLGPAFKQQEINAQAQKIIDAFAIMERGGADMNGVLDGMKDEISAVVQNSIKFGTTIPDNMKPWIEKLMESGQLVDENGEKITDITKVKFGEKMESEMDKLIKKLDQLISKLAGVREGFDRSTDAANNLADVPQPDWQTQPSGDGPTTHAARGGIIGPHGELRYLAAGGFVPRGTDTVPAMLTPGEMVTPADVTTEIVKSVKDRRNPGEVHILPIFLDGRASDREMVDEVFRQLPRRIAGNDANSRAALQRIIGANRVH
jgi:hypothetical protein